jgi:hypothetical protein
MLADLYAVWIVNKDLPGIDTAPMLVGPYAMRIANKDLPGIGVAVNLDDMASGKPSESEHGAFSY